MIGEKLQLEIPRVAVLVDEISKCRPPLFDGFSEHGNDVMVELCDSFLADRVCSAFGRNATEKQGLTSINVSHPNNNFVIHDALLDRQL